MSTQQGTLQASSSMAVSSEQGRAIENCFLVIQFLPCVEPTEKIAFSQMLDTAGVTRWQGDTLQLIYSTSLFTDLNTYHTYMM